MVCLLWPCKAKRLGEKLLKAFDTPGAHVGFRV